MSVEKKKIKVLYIAGSSRSGSTLLARMLNEIEGLFSVGEVLYIWDRGMRENRLCGCGVPFRDCEFWNRVLERVFGKRADLNPKDVYLLFRTLARRRHLPLVAWPNLRPATFSSNVKRYREVFSHVYGAICEQAGGDVIVDASKFPYHAFLLSEIPEIDLHVVHLIRDSRAVAYSWRRRKKHSDIHWKEAYMPQRNLIRVSLIWNWTNYFAGLLAGKCSSFSTLYYDDFARDPRKSLQRVATQAGLPNPDLSFLDRDSAELGIIHAFSGNPDRFERGPILIKPDEEWKKQMPKSHRLLVSCLTLPYLLKHGLMRSTKQKGAR